MCAYVPVQLVNTAGEGVCTKREPFIVTYCTLLQTHLSLSMMVNFAPCPTQTLPPALFPCLTLPYPMFNSAPLKSLILPSIPLQSLTLLPVPLPFLILPYLNV